MRRELDEIEMEMGKERTMQRGDEVRDIWGNRGVIETVHDGEFSIPWYVVNGLCYFGWQLTCTGAQQKPVEPERVTCADCGQVFQLDGCHWCPALAPSPGLLQRMGMATWEEDNHWFVMLRGSRGLDLAAQRMTRKEAMEWANWNNVDPDRKASFQVFHWDGLR
jgi:hypothetical protein